VAAAQRCVRSEKVNWPCYAAVIEDGVDQFEKDYAPWPLRFYVLQRDNIDDEKIKIKWICGTENGGYFDWLAIENNLEIAISNTKNQS